MSNLQRPNHTETIMTQVVQPNDTNPLGNLHGGKLMYWMDECSAISATKHSRAIVVTVSVDGECIAYFNHDAHGWSGMQAAENLVTCLAEKLGIEVEETTCTP